jgi:hypothetical protein
VGSGWGTTTKSRPGNRIFLTRGLSAGFPWTLWLAEDQCTRGRWRDGAAGSLNGGASAFYPRRTESTQPTGALTPPFLISGFPPRARVKPSGKQAEMDELRGEHWLLRSRESRNSPNGTRYRASEGRVRAAVKAHGGKEDSSRGFSAETVSRRNSTCTCSPRRFPPSLRKPRRIRINFQKRKERTEEPYHDRMGFENMAH